MYLSLPSSQMPPKIKPTVHAAITAKIVSIISRRLLNQPSQSPAEHYCRHEHRGELDAPCPRAAGGFIIMGKGHAHHNPACPWLR